VVCCNWKNTIDHSNIIPGFLTASRCELSDLAVPEHLNREVGTVSFNGESQFLFQEMDHTRITLFSPCTGETCNVATLTVADLQSHDGLYFTQISPSIVKVSDRLSLDLASGCLERKPSEFWVANDRIRICGGPLRFTVQDCKTLKTRCEIELDLPCQAIVSRIKISGTCIALHIYNATPDWRPLLRHSLQIYDLGKNLDSPRCILKTKLHYWITFYYLVEAMSPHALICREKGKPCELIVLSPSFRCIHIQGTENDIRVYWDDEFLISIDKKTRVLHVDDATNGRRIRSFSDFAPSEVEFRAFRRCGNEIVASHFGNHTPTLYKIRFVMEPK
jgi:hypothetical protein